MLLPFVPVEQDGAERTVKVHAKTFDNLCKHAVVFLFAAHVVAQDGRHWRLPWQMHQLVALGYRLQQPVRSTVVSTAVQ